MLLSLMVSCSDEDVTETSELEMVSSTEEMTISEEILTLVNEHRESIGLSELENNETAAELAKAHTAYMISINEINHDGFNNRIVVLQEEENARFFAENVAKFQSGAATVLDSWLNSEDHKKNIEGDYTHSGVAALKDEDGRLYFTQIFLKK
ncbi:CAP domain-containing protein [Aquimarina addita]